jgi:AcrR family transcriptional regulator
MATSQRVTGARPGGRSARVRAAVQTATLAELAAAGYAGLTIEAVAERAGVHRTTIYRRWPDKRSLVLAALLDQTGDQVPIPDTADLRRDLSLLGQAIDSHLSRPQVHALLATMVAGSPGSSELSDVRTQLWADRLTHAQAIPRRAVERGELPAGTDPAAVIDMLAGPVYLRRFIQGQPMTATEIDDLATRVAAAFTPLPSRAARPRGTHVEHRVDLPAKSAPGWLLKHELAGERPGSRP